MIEGKSYLKRGKERKEKEKEIHMRGKRERRGKEKRHTWGERGK